VTEHRTADWTAQQFQMIVQGDGGHRFVIHDRDTICAESVDRNLEAMGWRFSKHRLAFLMRMPSASA
jgi:hypothetical protein